jgi:hypothetical protein
VAAEALKTGILPLSSDPRLRRRGIPQEDELRVGDPDDSTLENEYAGEDLPGSASPTPDQNNVDEIGRAYGVQDEDSGALRTSSEVMARRDRNRVELHRPGAQHLTLLDLFPKSPLNRQRAWTRPGRRAVSGESARPPPARCPRPVDKPNRPGGGGVICARLTRPSTGASWARRRDVTAALWGADLVVDPNTAPDYLQGRRGSTVSIGLLEGRRPVLGVVFAFAYPDDAGDLFAWAEDVAPLTRNGRPVTPYLPRRLDPLDVVLVSSKGDLDPQGNLACAAPARYRAVPSIAHRLALVAAGEAAAATSLFAPGLGTTPRGRPCFEQRVGCS